MLFSGFVGVVGWTGRIWESIYAGCIPVVVAENTLFPFEDVVDYTKFALRFGFDELDQIEGKLRSITPEQRDHLQMETLKVRDQFRWPRVDQLHTNAAIGPSALDHVLRELAFAKQSLRMLNTGHAQ